MKRIGIYDSGCGGLSVVNQLILNKKEVEIMYYADSNNNPWGTKSTEALTQILKKISKWFSDMSTDFVICGCNTSYSLFGDDLDIIFNQPVINLITPIQSLVSDTYTILSTENTANSKTISTILQQIHPSCTFIDRACPGLAHAIETNQLDHQYSLLTTILPTIQTSHVILGCTHYPLIQPTMETIQKTITYINPVTYLINQLPKLPSSAAPINVTFNVNGSMHTFKALMNAYLNKNHVSTMISESPKLNAIY